MCRGIEGWVCIMWRRVAFATLVAVLMLGQFVLPSELSPKKEAALNKDKEEKDARFEFEFIDTFSSENLKTLKDHHHRWFTERSERIYKSVAMEQNNNIGRSKESSPEEGSYKVCIIGAGPSGLQLGYYFHQHHKDDYIILERSSIAGSFFQWYPRHRRLLSINKRFTGRGSRGYNLRHDWNSLLSYGPDGDTGGMLRFTRFSEDYYPMADDMVRYLNHFANETGLNIAFNTNVEKIKPSDDGSYRIFARRAQPKTFYPHANYSDIHPLNYYHVKRAEKEKKKLSWTPKQYQCGLVISANGKSVFRVPDVFAKQPAFLRYDLYDVNNIERFKNQTVSIYGVGNSAQEIYQSIMHVAAHTFMWCYGCGGRARKSWETHYPGDIRAVNALFHDAYQLKSNEGFEYDPLPREELIINMTIMDRTGYWTIVKDAGYIMDRFGVSSYEVAEHYRKCSANPRKYRKECRAIKNADNDDDGFEAQIKKTEDILKRGSRSMPREKQRNRRNMIPPSRYHEYRTPTSVLPHLAGQAKPAQFVILATGFKVDKSIYEGEISTFDREGIPVTTPEFESIDMPGIYFAGTLGHYRDWKRSGGGEIHGFRYTATALYHIIDRQVFGTEWPRRPLHILDMPEHITRRLNEADGIYQMWQTFVDAIVLPDQCGDNESALYVDDFPEDIIKQSAARFGALLGTKELPKRILTVGFRYHEDYLPPPVELERIYENRHDDAFSEESRRPVDGPTGPYQTNELHPVLSLLELSGSEYQEIAKLHLASDMHWRFDSINSHLIPMYDFLSCVVGCDYIIPREHDDRDPSNRAQNFNLKSDAGPFWNDRIDRCDIYYKMMPFVRETERRLEDEGVTPILARKSVQLSSVLKALQEKKGMPSSSSMAGHKIVESFAKTAISATSTAPLVGKAKDEL